VNRVAVTGVGSINPLGKTKSEFIENLKKMKTGTGYITQFDSTGHKVKVAAEIKDFDPCEYMDKKSARRYDRVLQLAVAASKKALEDSGLEPEGVWRDNAAVLVASGIGGFKTLYREFEVMEKKGPKAVSPYLIPMMIADMPSGVVSMELGLKGPNFSTVSACASSLHAIIISSMMIMHGYIDAAFAGGAEATIDPLPVAAFANMTALSQSEDPLTACRPFDRQRDGFVMGESSGVLVLENYEHALKRGAKIYGFINGFGMTGDAYHLSATDPQGIQAARAMKLAMEMSGIGPEDIDLVSCHATSTPVGDLSEIRAVKKALGESSKKVVIQASKALLGHGLGAAAATELIGAILQAQEGFVHGMPNLMEPDDEFAGLNMPRQTVNAPIKVILKNSFGFGGHNAALVYTKNQDYGIKGEEN